MAEIIAIKPVRIENVLLQCNVAHIRDSLQNITITHKSLIDFEIDGMHIRRWCYLGDTDSGVGVVANSFSENVGNFYHLKWEIPAGQRIPKDIYIRQEATK